MEAHGKNLFYFFGSDTADPVVMHVHFGMSGAFKLFRLSDRGQPAPTPTSRLYLEEIPSAAGGADCVAGLVSAMTVQHGALPLYLAKVLELGHDPLRDDADPAALRKAVALSKKSIGALLMDQRYFPGIGNIYRAEILFKAGVHPEIKGAAMNDDEYWRVWEQCVLLMRRGFETGSILTVDEAEVRSRR